MVDTAATEPAAILVVDDTESARELLAERLGELGHLIFLAESGPAALDLIEKQNFDAVILDVMMPGMNGLEVLRRVRETRGIAELPIIMATALGDRQDVVTALRAGANDFLTKPLDYHIVVARLETQLRLKRANDQILRLNRQLRQAQEQIARLAESSAEAMRDTRTWASTIADDLADLLGVTAIGVWLLEGEEIAATGIEKVDPPSPEQLIIAAEKKFIPRGEDTVIALEGMTGELIGALVVKGRTTFDIPERQLLHSFGAQLGATLQMQRMREDLSTAQSRVQSQRQDLIDKGVSLLKICPECGACHEQIVEYCLSDGAELEESKQLLPYRLLGRYRLDRIQARGGMSRIFEAFDETLDRPVAIKVMRPDQFRDESVRARFEQEAKAVARIHHPGVISIYDSGELDDGSLYIVMELLQGCDLSVMLRLSGAGRPLQVASFIRQTAAAISASHDSGFIHRDIKPENLFLLGGREGFRVKVLDYGIAKPIGSDIRLTQTGNFIGTPAYMSPEQMSGGKVDERSDLYSLAAVAFETITGRGVTLENDVAHIFYDILRNPAPLVSSLVPNTPRSVDDAFAAALSREPRERPPSANQWIETFVTDLENMASDVPGWEFGETAQSLEGRVTRPFGPSA